jgi:hypothetical protein
LNKWLSMFFKYHNQFRPTSLSTDKFCPDMKHVLMTRWHRCLSPLRSVGSIHSQAHSSCDGEDDSLWQRRFPPRAPVSSYNATYITNRPTLSIELIMSLLMPKSQFNLFTRWHTVGELTGHNHNLGAQLSFYCCPFDSDVPQGTWGILIELYMYRSFTTSSLSVKLNTIFWNIWNDEILFSWSNRMNNFFQILSNRNSFF